MAKITSKIDGTIVLAGGAIVLAALAAYANSFAGTYVFDDFLSLTDNPTIRHLWPLGPVLHPPFGGLTVSGRPFLNLSFAISYAMSGAGVWGYHALNLAIHILAGLALFGIVRRTLERVGTRESILLALAASLLWTLHPLQTESVTYIIQRAESLMGLLYLLTFYCFIRGVEAQETLPHENRAKPSSLKTQRSVAARLGVWLTLATVACLLGMATKEVMVSAPVTVLLYDRIFVTGSFRESWRRRRAFYLGLAATWLLLAYLVAGTGGRGGTSGFSDGVSWWSYWVTQFPAVVEYLRRSVWPHPLVFEYGFDTRWVQHPLEAAPYGLAVAFLVTITLWALRRRPSLGFLGVWFFSILAPTSVVPGTRQTLSEHRMYLALAPLAVLAALGIRWAVGRLFQGVDRKTAYDSATPKKAFFIVTCALALGLGLLTARRNEVYRTHIAFWSDVAAKRPGSTFAHSALGGIFCQLGRFDEAKTELLKAVQCDPAYAEARNNLGLIYTQTGHSSEAILQFQEALRLNPNIPQAHVNLANVLGEMGRRTEAIEHYQAALRLKPDYLEARNNLGLALAQVGRLPEAIAQYEGALTLWPDFAPLHYNLGLMLQGAGRSAEAKEQFAIAARLGLSP